MVNVIMLSVVILSVAAPLKHLAKYFKMKLQRLSIKISRTFIIVQKNFKIIFCTIKL